MGRGQVQGKHITGRRNSVWKGTNWGRVLRRHGANPVKECGVNWKKWELERCWEANPESSGRIFSSGLKVNKKVGRGRTGSGGTEEKRGVVFPFRRAEFEMGGIPVKKSSRCIDVQL